MNKDYNEVEDSLRNPEEIIAEQNLKEGESLGHVCNICAKVFSVSSNLKRHMRRIHDLEDAENKVVRKCKLCTLCEYKCRDNYQLKVHMRSHTKEKPFSCSQCNFKASKKEDCKRHMSTCKGPKYKCENCQAAFKSRSALNEHHIWDSVCGTLASREGDDIEETVVDGDRSIVKIIISKDASVVGVNCNQLLDKEVFEKKLRRTRCGLCFNCTSTESCGRCKVCINLTKTSSKQICLKRSCNNPIELFELKKDHVTIQTIEGLETSPSLKPKDEMVAAVNVGVGVPENEISLKNDIFIDGPVDMFAAIDNDFLVQDANLTVPMNESCNQASTGHSCILLHEDVLQL
eukprot:GFUD01018857.1.p1 GENE.GFUD01018857.1~~GFUD01018857.1.p1  ORF type:complete len:357 (+),score=80.60 GFUD01018857.1:36-1073(+)